MAVTASMVKELRERTGAGMMECKKALVETDGDMEAAVEHLRKSGLAKADKKASRVAAEGKIVLAESAGGTEAVLAEVNCETDFVAKDENFIAFAAKVAQAALESGETDLPALMETDRGGASLEQQRQALVAKLGENIQVRRLARMANEGGLGSYVHHDGRIGVLVALDGGDEELATGLAMHVSFHSPAYLDAAAIPAEVVEKERQIFSAQAEESGKPPEIVARMVEGRLRKYLAEITLTGQPFVLDGDVTVSEVLGFIRLAVGEGIEKKEENFADEVMQQVAGR